MSKTLLTHAEHELDLIGLTDDDEMNGDMRKHILHMIEEFSKEGHSGFSASYAIGLLSKLMKYEPLSPLTGEDSEWHDVSRENGRVCFQNKRASHVFKDESGAYDINGRVFYEWCERELEEDDEGYPGTRRFKLHYTSLESRTPVTFPYTPITEYVERASDAE